MNRDQFTSKQEKFVNSSIAFFCILSMGTSLSFWSSLPTNIFSQILFGGFAVLFEAVKYLAAWDIFQKRNTSKKFLSIGIYAVLLVISIVGTVGLLKSWVESGQKAKTEQLQEYQIASNRVNSKRSLIADLNVLVKKELENNYRSRSVKLLEQVKAEQVQLAKLEEHLLGVGGANVGSTMAVFGTGSIENILLLIMGALLEVSGAYLFSLKNAINYGAIGSNQKSKFKSNRSNKHSSTAAKIQNVLVPKKLDADAVDLGYHRIKSKILNGQLRPVTREIKEFVKLGSQKVNQLLLNLIADGVLEKTKTNRFIVCR